MDQGGRGRLEYCPQLDGLRAIAVVSVVLFHAASAGPFRGGFVGVDLFFVLSGYLITSILLAEQQATGAIDVRRFYIRRVRRLSPALIAMLLTYVAVAPSVWPGYQHFRDALVAASYLGDYGYAWFGIPRFVRHVWSLGVEEKFYLLWPVLVPLLARARRPAVIMLAVWALDTVWRISNSGWAEPYYRFDSHFSGLAVGAALAFLPNLKLPFWPAFGAFILISSNGAEWRNISITAAEVASACLVLSVSQGKGAFLGHPLLIGIGKLSYGIYLWHFPIALALRDRLGFLSTVMIALLASTLMAWLSYRTIERPARRHRDAGRTHTDPRPEAS